MFKNYICIVVAILMIAPALRAQDKFEVSVGADLVSGYIWRGQDLGGVSIQPEISIARAGFSLTAWGSVGFESKDDKEVDFTLGYEYGGFSIAVTDYWFDTEKYFTYAAHKTAHVYEATVGYDFGPVALWWNTNFAGADYEKANEKRAYSSYFEIAAPFTIGGVDFLAELGMTPWEGAYSDKFNVVNISVGAAKEIKITDTFTIPAFTKVTFNPNTEGAYFVFGVSF